MIELTRKIGVIVTAFLLIAATGGYSVYQHFCSCEGDTITSVFLELECGHDEAAPSCCTTVPTEKSCCDGEARKDRQSHPHSDDCCRTHAQFFKINDSFSSGQGNSSFKIFVEATVFFDAAIILNEDIPEPVGPVFSDTSPPASGRQILLEIHQLKLAPAEPA